MFSFVAFDVETTGTSVQDDEIIEIGAVLFEEGRAVRHMEILAKPEKEIPEDAIKVHGITNEMVAKSPPVNVALSKFLDFCGEHPLVAHNAPFDIKFIAAACKYNNVATPTGQVFDSYKMAKQTLTELFNFKLGTLVKHYKIPSTKFHRAEADAEYCGKVFIKLLKHISGTSQPPPLENITNLSGGELKFPEVKPTTVQLGLF